MIVSPTFSLVGVGVLRVGDGRPFGVLCIVWGALAAVAAARTETAQNYNCNFDNESLTLDPATAKGASYVRTLTRGATADIEVFDCPDEARTNLLTCKSLITDTLKREGIEGKAYKGNWQRLHFRTEKFEAQERSIAVLVVGDYLKVFGFEKNAVVVISKIRGMEIATDCKDSFPSIRLSFERPAEEEARMSLVPSTDESVKPPAGDGKVWLPVAMALLVLLALVVIFSVAVCCRLRRRVASQELEALGQSSTCTHPALSSSPSPSLAEAKSRHDQRYSTLLASDAVAVPNGHSKSGGGGHLSGLPDLAPPPLPSTSPPSLPHHPDGASPPPEAVDVRRTLEWRDNSCHGDAKGPQETPWSSADDGEDDYADPEELETPLWLRIQGADDDEEHDYADPRELEKPAWLLAQDADDYHDYDYIDRDALKVMLDRDREETQRKSAAAEEGSLSRHDSENSLYEEMKTLEAARESREEQRQIEQQREEREQQKRQEGQEVEEQQQRYEKEKRQQMEEEEEQDQNEPIQQNQADELKESEQEILESGKLEAK
ncbi:uncharacterized protein LOC125039739 isoform X2 [Penaeus chinensis]|uniref:uncharacterized protein LOC125039739 isoform X2 n=1 Tax=Penaeus chinensis TaxID=139456 RepID=UPI001FB6A516|nr:uncharacterized protein LOC125039739 isoform X2 [Penaeus chinensis]